MNPKDTGKSVFFVAISQFGLTLSFSFMMSFLPFYIIHISPFGPKETMIWIGMILGAPHFVTALTATFWGSLTSKFSPKLLYERGFFCHGILILLMGFTDNLYLLLMLRIIQGTLGGVSTIGLILISSLSPTERIQKDLSLFQNSMTMGQLVGPILGTYCASLWGYRAAFFFTFFTIYLFLFFCHRYVIDTPRLTKITPPIKSYKKALLGGWTLSLVATIHLAFIPGILPTILKGFHMNENAALNTAGIIIMSYTGTAILGNYLLSRLSYKLGIRKVIILSCLMATLFQFLLIFSQGVHSFTVIRMIQTGFIAVVLPLTISMFARDAGGGMIGFLNSARFFGMALGPIFATSVLAYSNLIILYLLITGITLFSLWVFLSYTPRKI